MISYLEDLMKKYFKSLVILFITVVFLAGCKGEQNSPDLEKENVGHENSVKEKAVKENIVKENINKEKTVSDDSNRDNSKLSKSLKPVEGAKIGSLSSFVDDREVWNDLFDEKYIDSAKSYGSGLHVPRILLDSPDAKTANDEIDDLVKYIKNTYGDNKDNMEGSDTGICAFFSVYQDEKILSVMIENYDIWNGGFTNYYVYNFSLPDGNFIDDDKLMENFGVDRDEILGIIENSLREDRDLFTKIYCRDVTDLSYTSNPSNLTGLILNDLWDNYDSKNHQIFIDEVGIPNFVFANYESADRRRAPLILKLRKDKFEDNPISDQYLRIARDLGIDPNDENNKAFLIYLGGAYDDQSLKDSLGKLQAYLDAFTYDFEEPNMLVAIKQSEGGDMPYLNGQDCYLVIPKYKNASVSLKELEITEEGKLKEVDNPYLDNNACSGTTFICQNISDIGPNGKITIRYRDDVLEFSPSISLKDGSLILPEGVTNAEKILDLDKLVQKVTYPYLIYERMKFIMGVG